MNRLRLCLARLTLLAVVMSCSDNVAPQSAPRVANLRAAQARWRSRNLHTYAFSLRRTCFCANTHRLFVIVKDDAVVGVFDLDDGVFVDSVLGVTIEGLFSFVQHAIDRPAQKIDVQYDAAQGFPALIDYDGSAQIADDEIEYHVSDVHLITPQQ
jgi:hypothetical protein